MQQSTKQEHRHDIVYYGAVNLIHNSVIMGTIDIWKCRSCSEIFCEDKRYGVQDLAAEVGFPKIEQGAKWAALVCIKEKGADWTLTGAKPGNVIHHSCTPETKVDILIGNNYDIEQSMVSGIGKHRIILLEDFVNEAVDVDTVRKHTGPTNANQAPGRAFSFPTEKSGVPTLTAWYNSFVLSAAFSLVSGLSASALGLLSGAMTVAGALLLMAGLVGIATSYITVKRKVLGPLGGFASSALGVLGLAEYSVSSVSLTVVVVLGVLYIVNAAFAWRTYQRIRAVSGQKWHPLDMPAYG